MEMRQELNYSSVTVRDVKVFEILFVKSFETSLASNYCGHDTSTCWNKNQTHKT